MNKRGITPLLATFLLIIFAMLLGSVVMSFGKSYIDSIETPVEEPQVLVCDPTIALDSPLKELQVQYINGDISQEEYFVQSRQYLP